MVTLLLEGGLMAPEGLDRKDFVVVEMRLELYLLQDIFVFLGD